MRQRDGCRFALISFEQCDRLAENLSQVPAVDLVDYQDVPGWFSVAIGDTIVVCCFGGVPNPFENAVLNIVGECALVGRFDGEAFDEVFVGERRVESDCLDSVFERDVDILVCCPPLGEPLGTERLPSSRWSVEDDLLFLFQLALELLSIGRFLGARSVFVLPNALTPISEICLFEEKSRCVLR